MESFTYEKTVIILLALADEFGSNDHGSVGSDYFNREQKWREEHRLEPKIERVKPVIRARRPKEEADRIIQKLPEYRPLAEPASPLPLLP